MTAQGVTVTGLDEMAREFHTTLRVHSGWSPPGPTVKIPPHLHERRQELMDEEAGELAGAVEERDLVKIADALADIIYVAAGTAFTYGIPLDAVLAEVHRSNMTKTNVPGQHKLAKGPGYEPPRIAAILAAPPAGSVPPSLPAHLRPAEQPAAGQRPCARDGCDKLIPFYRFLCNGDWKRVPKRLRDAYELAREDVRALRQAAVDAANAASQPKAAQPAEKAS